MNSEPGGPDVLLVVEPQSSSEQVSRIIAFLRQLEIPAEVVGPGVPLPEPAHIALRVPAQSVVAAVLALEQCGFTRVKAYGSEGQKI